MRIPFLNLRPAAPLLVFSFVMSFAFSVLLVFRNSVTLGSSFSAGGPSYLRL
jgi:hypothetical protein